ncbi:hypothetical protein Ae201684P_004426 [Aphanomyces euteiches]|nr:hypothetical protein Ae201684P_004426 [Aphanomyces euteiches]
MDHFMHWKAHFVFPSGSQEADHLRGHIAKTMRRNTMTSRGLGDSGGSSSHSASTSSKFPLPNDHFRVPKLSSNETEFFNSVARKSCTKVIYYARLNGGPVTWIPISSPASSHVQVYMGKMAGDTSSTSYFCATTQLHASLDQVAQVFRHESTAEFREFAKSFAPDYFDCATLTNLVLPSDATPMHYIGLKWAAVESPTMFIKHRDFCFLECQDEFVDRRTGRRGWVNSMHSVSWDHCSPMEKSHGLVRASIYRYVFIESDTPNCLEVIHVLQVDLKGSLPQWVTSSVMRRRVMEVGRLQHFFRVKNLDPKAFFAHVEPKKHALYCQVCHDKFAFTKRHCRKCGTVVCKKCSSDILVDLDGTGPVKIRVCIECTNKRLSYEEASVTAAADETCEEEPQASKAQSERRRGKRYQSSDWFMSHRAALMANPFRPSVSLSCDAANSSLVADIAEASVEVQEEIMPMTSKMPTVFQPRSARLVVRDGLKRMRQARGANPLGETFGIEQFNPEDISFHSLDRPSSVMKSTPSSSLDWQFNSLLAMHRVSHSTGRVSDVSDLSLDEEDEENEGDNDGPVPLQSLAEEAVVEDHEDIAAPPTSPLAEEVHQSETQEAVEEPNERSPNVQEAPKAPEIREAPAIPATTPTPTTPSIHPYALVSEMLICPSVQSSRRGLLLNPSGSTSSSSSPTSSPTKPTSKQPKDQSPDVIVATSERLTIGLSKLGRFEPPHVENVRTKP